MFIDIFVGILYACLGAIFASFFGVIICREPQGLSIVTPGSRCDNCGHELKWHENIPIFSFIFLKGKCKECGAKIGAFSLVYELIGALVMALTYVHFRLSIELIFATLIVLLMLLIGGYDYKTNTILDIFWILMLLITLGYDLYRILMLNAIWWHYLAGAGILGGFFLIIKGVFYLIKKQDVLGTGDVIFMAIAGLLLGYKTVLIALFFGSVVGAIVELTLVGLKIKDRESMIPFCPYLTLGVFIAYLYGQGLIDLVIG